MESRPGGRGGGSGGSSGCLRTADAPGRSSVKSSLGSEAERLAHELADHLATHTRGPIAATQDGRACRRLELRAGARPARREPGSARPNVSTTYSSSTRPVTPACARPGGYRGAGCSMTSTGSSTESAVHGSLAPMGTEPPNSDPGSPGARSRQTAPRRSATPGETLGSTSGLGSGAWKTGSQDGVGAAPLRMRSLAAGSGRAWGATNTRPGIGCGGIVRGEACRVNAMAPATATPWKLTDNRNRSGTGPSPGARRDQGVKHWEGSGGGPLQSVSLR